MKSPTASLCSRPSRHGRWPKTSGRVEVKIVDLAPLGGVRAISYRGELVAFTTRARVYLAPEVSALPRGNPKLRFVAALCLYSREVDTGWLVGPYRSEDA